jgi:pimeloyl-ACP methyl ester carboxylesterase
LPVAYDRLGHGPPLVLLHPLGADRRVWHPVVERLRDRRELVVVDLPGFGDSAPLNKTPTPAALARAISEFLESIEIEQPHVAGISLGGWVALELGLAGAATTTTAIAPAGLWPEPLELRRATKRRTAGALAPLIGVMTASKLGRRLLLAGVVAHPERVPGADAAHLIRAWATAPGFVDVNRAMRAGRFEQLAEINGPVTLVWTEHDRLIHRLSSAPDNVRQIELADAGHLPVWDAPDALGEILLEATRASADGSQAARVETMD